MNREGKVNMGMEVDAFQAAGAMTLLAVLFTFYAGFRAGTLRGAKNISAPATVGDPEFERAFRIHMNTIESLVLFLPLLWVAALTVNGLIALSVGFVWLLGRIMYMTGYMADPAKRGPGALLTMASIAGLFFMSLWGVFTYI